MNPEIDLDLESNLSRIISFEPFRLEPHVRTALVLANLYAARAELTMGGVKVTRTGPSRPIQTFDLLYAISAVAQSGIAPGGDDSAFTALLSMLALSELPQIAMSTEDGRRSEGPLVFDYSEPLAQSLVTMMQIKRRGSETNSAVIWGRDLVTACLLAMNDSSFERFASSNLTLAELQDSWHRFVIRSRHRAPSFWNDWWWQAGLPLPEERRLQPKIDTGWHPLASGLPPPWASEWGQDAHGVFIAFTIDGVTQRLRWIPPGRFLMGSPEHEAGRGDTEGPRHAVTMAKGFWLFDTAATQALWVAVMGDNPSRFKSRDRPVEQVSWDDVQNLMARVNERVPGLALVLPSEAQWEYACRAGTETAVWTGPLEILGAHNAPALDPIAWYSGNSGQGFELEEGHDSWSWPEKQYPHKKAGTRPVGLKAANPWGLYDMLGNVWEWCADDWHDSYNDAPSDGGTWLAAASESGGRLRVARGGSWRLSARYVRAACRDRPPERERIDFLGFRCARGQV